MNDRRPETCCDTLLSASDTRLSASDTCQNMLTCAGLTFVLLVALSLLVHWPFTLGTSMKIPDSTLLSVAGGVSVPVDVVQRYLIVGLVFTVSSFG